MSMAHAPQMALPAESPVGFKTGSVTSPLPEGQSGQLTATAQYLVFEPGLYAIDVVAERSIVTEMGLVLPSVRLEPLPPTRLRPGRISVIDPIATGWLSQREEATFAFAVGGRAAAIMTIYRAKQGVPVPEIRIRSLDPAGHGAPGAIGPAMSQDGLALEPLPHGAAPAVPISSVVPLAMVCHISRVGDVRAAADGWLGQRGSGAPIEGFSIAPAVGDASPLRPGDIEYQGILGNNWKTPWIPGGAFCGSRGMMLPLLGLCVRLKGAAAEAFACSYDARFTDGQETRRSCAAGEFCRAGDVPLEAFRIVITARGAARPQQAEPAASGASDNHAPSSAAEQAITKPLVAAAAAAAGAPTTATKARPVPRIGGRRTTIAAAANPAAKAP